TNDQLLQNKVISKFLQAEENERLLEKILMDHSDENIKKLDKQFKEYYLKVKLIKYISSLIHFYTIDFDKRNNKRNSRFMLTLDAAPYKDDPSEDAATLIDIQPSPHSTETDYFEKMQSFNELIESVKLYNAYQKLTSKQQEVLDMMYIDGFNNKEVAHIFNETPQNISNIHKRALKKLKESYSDERE